MNLASQVLVAGVAKKACCGKKAVGAGSDPWQNSGDAAKLPAEQSSFSGAPTTSNVSHTTPNPVANATPSWGNQSAPATTAPSPVFAPAAAPNPWGALEIDESGGGASF
jgi:hypothetical protein|eukprot:COSAG02_NODE_480_length_21469_cov_13.479551_12_plen_109_part_00